MNAANECQCKCGKTVFLALLIATSNVCLLLCMAGLCFLALCGGDRFGSVPPAADASHQIVSNHIAERVPNSRYRICEWFPASPLEGSFTATADEQWLPVREKGFAQRVRIEFYGPSGVRPLDTVYWVQDGKVTRRMDADDFRFADEPLPCQVTSRAWPR